MWITDDQDLLSYCSCDHSENIATVYVFCVFFRGKQSSERHNVSLHQDSPDGYFMKSSPRCTRTVRFTDSYAYLYFEIYDSSFLVLINRSVYPKEGAVVHLFTTLALTEVSLLPWGFAQRLNPILVIPFLSCQQKVQIFTYPVKFDAHILIPFNKTLGSHFYFSSIVSFYAPDTFCSWLKSRQYCAKVMRHSSFHSRFPGKMTNKCNSLSKRLQTWMEILYKMSYNELEAQCLVWGLLFFNRA